MKTESDPECASIPTGFKTHALKRVKTIFGMSEGDAEDYAIDGAAPVIDRDKAVARRRNPVRCPECIADRSAGSGCADTRGNNAEIRALCSDRRPTW